jgi:nucleoid-associated protein YgaU
MTRETKLGLLVGLTFIIVIAVLLADHLAQMSDPKPAELSDAASKALEALQIPDGPNPAMQKPAEPQNVMPVRPVMTLAEVNNQARQGTAMVEVGNGQAGQAPVQIISNRNAQQTGTAVIGDTANPPLVSVGPVTPMAAGPTRAGMLPEAGPLAGPTTRRAETLAVAPVPEAPKTMEIKAAAGDNVAKWAKKYLGSDTPANRELIIKANQGLSQTLQNIKVGKTYVIPLPAPKSAPAATNTVAAVPTTMPAPAVVASTATELPANQRSYTVKAGDNLWKIAREQCRDAKAVDEIRKLNKEALKGGDALKVGSKLILPAR